MPSPPPSPCNLLPLTSLPPASHLQNRPSADPSDPLVMQLEAQLAVMGRAPRRQAMGEEEREATRARAQQRVRRGEVRGWGHSPYLG